MKFLKSIPLISYVIGITSTYIVLNIQTDPQNIVFLGFSLNRLILLIFMLVLTLSSGFVFILWVINKNIVISVQDFFVKHKKFAAIGLCLLVLFIYTALVISDQILGMFAIYRQRILSLILWSGCISLLVLCWLIFLNLSVDFISKLRTVMKRYFWWYFWSLLGVLILFGFIFFTHLGIDKDKQGWYQASVPLLTWQVWFGLVCALFLGWFLSGLKYKGTKQVDIGIFLIIWVFAAFIWNLQPVSPNFFIKFNEFTGQYYPYSDAMRYSFMAESLYSGWSIWPQEDKIAYYIFLGAIQLFTKLDYWQSATVQASILALMPSVFFLFGKAIHSRSLGILLALLSISKEINAIVSGQALNLSHSKLLLTEVPQQLVLVLVALILFKWWTSKNSPYLWIAFSGFLVGLAALLRLNSYAIIPVVLGFSLFAYLLEKRGRQWLKDVALFLTVLLVVLLPWNVISSFELGAPYSLNKFINSIESRDFFIGGDQGTLIHSQRVGDFKLADIKQSQNKPFYFVVSSHFLHNQLMSVFILPMTYGFEELNGYYLHPIWNPKVKWEGRLSDLEIGLFVFNLILFSGGVAYATRRWRLAGLTPLIVQLGYFLGSSLARTSGGRYVVPVDWVYYFYYALALISILAWLFRHGLGIEIVNELNESKQLIPFKVTIHLFVFVIAVAILLGFSIPIITSLTTSKCQQITFNAFLPYYHELPELQKFYQSEEKLNKLVSNGKRTILCGKALYTDLTSNLPNTPYFEKVSGVDAAAFSFLFVSSMKVQIILPLENINDLGTLPNSGDVILILCDRGKTNHRYPVFADAVLWINKDGLVEQVNTRSKNIILGCSGKIKH